MHHSPALPPSTLRKFRPLLVAAAFAVATLLAGLALITLVLKSLLEWRFAGELAATKRH